MASPNAGGFVELTINGTPYSIAGELKIRESNKAVESVVNQDGTINRIIKPQSRKFDLMIRDRQGASSIIETLLEADRLDVSAHESHMRRTVLLTDAFATGELVRDTSNGEISGVSIEASQIRYVVNG